MSQKNELNYAPPSRPWRPRLNFLLLLLSYVFLTAAIVAGLTEEKLDHHKDPRTWLIFPSFDHARAMRGIALQNTDMACALISFVLSAIVFVQLVGLLNDGRSERKTKILQWSLMVFAATASVLWAFRPHLYS